MKCHGELPWIDVSRAESMMLRTSADAMLSNVELRQLSTAEHLMAMPALRRHWTVDEVNRLIDEREQLTPRYELVDGELLVTPAPSDRHQRIVFELAVRLRAYVRQHRLGEVRLGPAEARLTPDAHLEPDVFVVAARNGQMPRVNEPVLQLLVAVEVLSPGSARHDRVTKRRFLVGNGVPEYWVVDGEAEVFEAWRPGDERALLLDERLVWAPDSEVAAFELNLREFFAAVAD